MQSTQTISTHQIRIQFTQAMSEMYQLEVPLYKKLLSLADDVNDNILQNSSELSENQTHLLKLEHHGAIRLGSASELSMIRRLFKVMGMQPVDYYDLSVAGIPVHSTAFRSIDSKDLQKSPFRVFCSLLRLDLIEDIQLREQANEILGKRQIFPEELIGLIELSEKQGGLESNQAKSFIEKALEVFRWHQNATVDSVTYNKLKASHGLIADIVSFKGPHINHLTPKVLDIDECQYQFTKNDIKAKALVEGPPKRNCPILLRQTSFIAIAEQVTFSDGESGKHTARFGEVEQRGMALTPKGRDLYDRLLTKAKNGNSDMDYNARLHESFKEFPDDYEQIHQQELGYFYYSANNLNEKPNRSLSNNPFDATNNIDASKIDAFIEAGLINIKPIIYEDFLPVSAAGIFTSNLATESQAKSELDVNETVKESTSQSQNANLESFEEAMGTRVVNSFDLYERLQQQSLDTALVALVVSGTE